MRAEGRKSTRTWSVGEAMSSQCVLSFGAPVPILPPRVSCSRHVVSAFVGLVNCLRNTQIVRPGGAFEAQGVPWRVSLNASRVIW